MVKRRDAKFCTPTFNFTISTTNLSLLHFLSGYSLSVLCAKISTLPLPNSPSKKIFFPIPLIPSSKKTNIALEIQR